MSHVFNQIKDSNYLIRKKNQTMHTIQGTLLGLNIKSTKNPEITKIGFLITHVNRNTWYNAFTKSNKQLQMYRNLKLNQEITLVLNVDNLVVGIQ